MSTPTYVTADDLAAGGVEADPFPWMADAACRGEDLDVFFPEKSGHGGEAKALCALCPVRQECLEYALVEGIDEGVFGGLSPNQRGELDPPEPDYPPHRCPTGVHPEPSRNCYTRHCHCEGCTAAATAYNAARRTAQREDQAAR